MNATGHGNAISVTLSERNLRTLLAKLDEPRSYRTLMRRTESGILLWVTAERDKQHYEERIPGDVAPWTEQTLREQAESSNIVKEAA